MTTANAPVTIAAQNIKTVPVSKIQSHSSNARQHSDDQIVSLMKSMREFGFTLPLLVDEKLTVLAGHGRLEAAKRLGMPKIPVIVISNLSDSQKRAYLYADNKLSELSSWDEATVKKELSFLVNMELKGEFDIDFQAMGLTTIELDNIVFSSSFEDTAAEQISAEDNIPTAVLSQSPISKSGDLWKLGQHRIICGDSLEPDTYKRLLGSETISLICTDPPYNVPIHGFVSGKGATKHREFKNASGEYTPAEFELFLKRSLTDGVKYTKEGGLIYIYIDWRHIVELTKAAKALGLIQINMCVWDKGVAAMGSLYRSRYELVLVFRKGNTSHKNNVMLGKYGRNRSNVWSYPSANMSKEGRQALKSHPTPKPVTMFMDLMKDVTAIHDIVLDPFLGSGTTLLAAEKTGRHAYCIEVDPLYVDLAIRRWETLTGKKAIHAVTGKSFAENSSAKKIRKRERKHV